MSTNTSTKCPHCSIFTPQAIEQFGSFGCQMINELLQKIKLKDDLIRLLQSSLIKSEREKAMLENKLKGTRSGAPTSIKSLCVDYYFLDDCKLAKGSRSVILEAIEEETETKEEESDAEMLSDI